MKKVIYILFFAIAIFSQIANGQITINQPTEDDVVEGKVRVKLKREILMEVGSSYNGSFKSTMETTGVSTLDALNKQIGITRITRVFPFSLQHEPKHREYGLHLWLEMDFDVSKDPNAIAELYQKLDEVDIAKPLYVKTHINGEKDPVIFTTEGIISNGKKYESRHNFESNSFKTTSEEPYFNDPLLPQQWHYENDGTVGSANNDIDLSKAWIKQTGNPDIIVAIVDGGIDVNHEDLIDNLWINQAEKDGEPGVDDDNNGYVDDIHGFNFKYGGNVTAHRHGTHVAGTVGAVSNNGKGVAGVAGGNGTGNGVRLMSCQIYDERSGGSGNIAAAIVYGADNGAVISQNSWGYNTAGFYEPEVYEAIKYFVAEAGNYEGSLMQGGILFFASGNDGFEKTQYPSAFEEVVAVSASGPTGQPTPYTNYGTHIDITAPGGDQAYYKEEGGVLSTMPENQYGYYQGTSMACPHVSGVAALAIAEFGGPAFSADDLRSIILNSAKPFTFEHEDKFGSGILNARNVMAEDERIAPDAITDLAARDISHNQMTLQWTVPNDSDNFQPTYFLLAVSTEEITATNFGSDYLIKINNAYEAGSDVEVTFSGFQKKTDYWFAVKSADQYENISLISNIIKVTTTDEPHFMESTREIELTFDLNVDTVKQVPVTFSNTGEGIVYWNSFTVNENEYWIEQEQWGAIIDNNTETINTAQSGDETTQMINYASTTSYDGAAITENNVSQLNAQVEDDYWRNDNTVSATVYNYSTGGNIIQFGSPYSSSGVIMATRYQVPKGSSFNLTQIEVPMYFESLDNPMYIDIRSGSEFIEQSERVHVQEYFHDTADFADFFRIPIFKPQLFESEEFFWVVLHMPKEEAYPLFIEYALSYIDYTDMFMLSFDNGATYKDAYKVFNRRMVSLVRALSSGVDGSYVFIDPVEGEIAGGDSQPVNITVDASNLSNGKHLAGVGIRTTDQNKPGINIEVKVIVEGHKGEVKPDDLYEFNVKADTFNYFDLDVQNIGLGDLVIYDVLSIDSGFVKDFEDSIIVAPKETKQVAFAYKSSVAGTSYPALRLSTNVGEIVYNTKINVYIAPTIALSIDNNIFDIAHNATAQAELTISNTSTETNLEYDLSDYDKILVKGGLNPGSLSYSVLNSIDNPGLVTPNQWDDISEFGTSYSWEMFHTRVFDMKMDFPFYNRSFNSARGERTGVVWLERIGVFGNDTLPYANSQYGSGVFEILQIDTSYLYMDDMYHYSYGDRDVFTFNLHMARFEGLGFDKEDKVEVQFVLFRDGAIEYRYKNVENVIALGRDFRIGMQGLEKEDYLYYRDFNDGIGKPIQNGLVIRFEPQNHVNILYSSDDLKGSILPSGQKKIIFTIDPSVNQIYYGTINNSISVNSNTLEGVNTIPLTINVSGGISSFEVQDTLEFGSVHTGHPETGLLNIANTGDSIGQVISITFDNADFSTSANLPYSMGAKSEIMFPVVYDPSAPGNIDGTIMRINFSNGVQEVVVINGTGKNDPAFTYNAPAGTSVSLNGGETTTIPFSINNQDLGVDLEYNFINSVFTMVAATGKQNASVENPDFIDGQYGYSWKLSDSTRIFYKWNDISETADTMFIVKHEMQKIVPLPFDFPFYGNLYDTIWISKNGYVTVVKPQGDKVHIEFEAGDGLAGIITPFISNIEAPQQDKGVLYKEEADRVYVQWDKYVGDDQGSSGVLTFQLELVNDGSIYFHYKQVEEWTGVLNYGLESPDESEKFETEKTWILSWSELMDNMTIAIAPPLQEKIATGQTQDFNLNISAENIYHSGVYQDTVILNTNSKSQPEYIIPVTLNVTGQANLVAPAELDFGDIVFNPEGSVMSQKIELLSNGHETATISKIMFDQAVEINLYETTGEEITRVPSSGSLLYPIEIEPWFKKELVVELVPNQQLDINGAIEIIYNSDTISIAVKAKLVDSPLFDWDATDLNLSLYEYENHNFSFNIFNNGETPLNYDLIPMVMPEQSASADSIIEDIGNYSLESPLVVDSLAWDVKDKAEGIWTPMIWGSPVSFGSEFIAPEGGFVLTHFKTVFNFTNLAEYINISISVGGHAPDSGRIVYQQNYVIDEITTEEWVYFELQNSVFIEEYDTFYIAIAPPFYSGLSFIGYETTTNPEAKGRAWNATPYAGWGKYWDENTVYKIRPLTASGKNMWIELDNLGGQVAGGESVSINTTIDTKLAGKGNKKATVLIKTNDINAPNDQFDVNINVNGSPEIKLRPNLYADTVRITELEELTLNYLFVDPEGEAITFEVDDSAYGLDADFIQTSGHTAKVVVKTDYESAGVYTYGVSLTDASGNVTKDEILLEVMDKNRTPVLNPDYSYIQLNLSEENPSLSIKAEDLFTDPDNDELAILAGNYTPDIVDLSLGYSYIDLHPLQEGTGFVVFGADDGKENGFIVYGVYVTVLNDPDAVSSDLNNVDDQLMIDSEVIDVSGVFPNVISAGAQSQIFFKLEETADIEVNIVDINGRIIMGAYRGAKEEGIHAETLNLSALPQGLYFCQLKINNDIVKADKIIIR